MSVSQVKQSDVRNHLLAGLTPDDFSLLAPQLQWVDLPFKQVLISPDEPIRQVCFIEQGLGSLLTLFEGGGSIEVGLVGRDGMVGVPILLGVDNVSLECLVQIPGSGLRMEAAALRRAMGQSPSLQARLLRYAMSLLAQVSQTAACNGAHAVEQRLARWLLMSHDRCDGDALPLTQEFLATMLGVRRASVTVAAGIFQKAGILSYANGDITILNRPALEMASCACYRALADETHRIFG